MIKYIRHYDKALQQQVQTLIDSNKLGEYLLTRYDKVSIHNYASDKALYEYVMNLKNTYIKSAPPISKVIYDAKMRDISATLGTHTYVKRVQGGKLKAKNEIRIASVFKKLPEPFLKMITTHELAHIKHKDHDKDFYKLCLHIEPNYYQLEFDVRLYLIYKETFGELYS